MRRKLLFLWIVAAASAAVFTISCNEDSDADGTGPAVDAVAPPTIGFAGDVKVDESGEWPVASVEVSLSSDAERWYWMFAETRGYEEWSVNMPDKTKIEFPVLRSGTYTLSVKAGNAGGESDIATKDFDVEVPAKYGEVFAAIDWELNDAKTAVVFTVTTTEATEAWYYEFAEADKATEYDGGQIPPTFTAGTENRFEVGLDLNRRYKMTVIAENAKGRKATAVTVGVEWAEPVMEIAAAEFDYVTDCYTATLKPSRTTTEYYYYWGPIDATDDGGEAGGDPYSVSEIAAMIGAGDLSALTALGFTAAEGNESLTLEYRCEPYFNGAANDNSSFHYGMSESYTPYGLVAFAANAAGFSEPKVEWPVAPAPAFYNDPEIEVNGPWSVDVALQMGNGLQSFVIAAIPSADTAAPGSGAPIGGFSEAAFIDEAKNSINAHNAQDQYGIQRYTVVTSGLKSSFNETDLLHNATAVEAPKGLHLIPDTDYTLAVYAVTVGGGNFVKTWQFRSQPFTTSAEVAKPVMELVANGTSEASVRITAPSGTTRLFYGYEATYYEDDSGRKVAIVLDNERVSSLFSQNMSGSYDVFSGWGAAEAELKFRKPNLADDYYVYAVAVDDSGRISDVSVITVEPVGLTHDSTAAVTGVTWGEFSALDAHSNPYAGYLAVTLECTADVEGVLVVSTTEDYRPENGSDLERWYISGYNVQEFGRANGELGADGSIRLYYTQADKKHYCYAMPYDRNGNYGRMVNMALPTGDIADEEVFNLTYTYSGTFDRGEAGSDLFTQSLASTCDYTDWLKLTFQSTTIQEGINESVKVTLNNPAPKGVEEVRELYVVKVSADSMDAKSLAENVVEFFRYNTYPDWPVGGMLFTLNCLHSGPVSAFTEVETFLTSHNTTWGGGQALAAVLLDNRGGLTIMAAAVPIEGSREATIVDLTHALNE